MGVRLSTSYSWLAGTNSALRIDLTAVTAERCLWVGYLNVNTSGRAAAQARIRIALAATMSPVLVVTEDAAESISNVAPQ